MHVIKRLKIFARRENIIKNRSKWGWNTDDYDIPDESKKVSSKTVDSSIKKEYSYYNLAWINEYTGNFIKNFKLIEPFSERFINQMNRLDEISLQRLNICIDHLRNGKFVYTDDDVTQDDDTIYKDKTDSLRYKWDTMTHYLVDFQDQNMDELPYSKQLNEKDRLTYAVQRPVVENGKLVCYIRLSSCEGHLYNTTGYSRDKYKRNKRE